MESDDTEFLDGLIGRPITVSDRVRLFALARRGAELQTLMAENERLREVLKRALEEDADGHVKWQTRKDARAALEERT